MNILAIDTSGNAAGVALWQDHGISFEKSCPGKRTHSSVILPLINTALSQQGLTVGDIDLFACVNGPGSFTGVRIGVSTIKGLAHATGRPCVGINALQALAAGVVAPEEALLCPMIDARSGQVYAAAFTPGGVPLRKMEDNAGPLEEMLTKMQALSSRLLFVGDGAVAYRAQIEAFLGGGAVFAEDAVSLIQPGAVARLALDLGQDEAGDYLALTPHYLRAPQAERERLCREASHGG